MRTDISAAGLAGVLLAIAMAGTGHAGGFSRGTADTDILYEDGRISLRNGLTFVSPSRRYETIEQRPATDGNVTDDFTVPSLAAKVTIGDALSCAGTYTRPFGAFTENGPQASAAQILAGRNASFSSQFDSDEYAATCAAHAKVGVGEAYLLGGIFLQSLDYKENALFGTLRLSDDEAYGYRLGAAYDIPEYAFRAQILYRSAVDHEGVGTMTVSKIAESIYGIPAGTQLDASGRGTLPQSLEISLRSGIAEDWLAFGSVKWSDWSVLPALDYSVAGVGSFRKSFNFRDGWTLQGGIAHNFTKEIAGLASLTWDRGVGTGADILADSWTLGAGAQLQTEIGTFRLGAAATYMTAAQQSVARGALFNATTGGDWAFAVTTSYGVNF